MEFGRFFRPRMQQFREKKTTATSTTTTTTALPIGLQFIWIYWCMQWLVSLWSQQMVRYSWKLYRCDFFWFGFVPLSIFPANNKLLILIVRFPLFLMGKKFMSTKRFIRMFLLIEIYGNISAPFFRYDPMVAIFWMLEWNGNGQSNLFVCDTSIVFQTRQKTFGTFSRQLSISLTLHGTERNGVERIIINSCGWNFNQKYN